MFLIRMLRSAVYAELLVIGGDEEDHALRVALFL